MIKITLIVSLIFSLILCGYFLITDDGVVLAPALLGILVSFTCAMISLSGR